jgi:hypothetical protein
MIFNFYIWAEKLKKKLTICLKIKQFICTQKNDQEIGKSLLFSENRPKSPKLHFSVTFVVQFFVVATAIVP